MIDILFFEAAATIKPTLLIGVVFSGKLLENWKLELDETTNHAERQGRISEYLEGISFFSWLLITAIVGESAALAAIASGNPHVIYLVLVLVPISFLLTSVAGMGISQPVNRLDEQQAKKTMGSYILIGVSLIVFLLLIPSATVLPEIFK